MFSKIKNKKLFKRSIYLTIVSFLIGFGFFLLAKTALAQFGLEYATASGLGTRGLKPMVFSIINVLLGFLGIVAVVILIYGGFVWMTAGGNQEKVSRAKKILLNGLIGLFLILASWGIANFVLGSLWGATGGGGPTPGSPCDCVTELGVCSGCLRCQNTGGPGVCTWQSDVTCGPVCTGLPGAKTFYAQNFQPTSPPDAIRNAVVRITFRGVNTSSQPGAINYGTNFSVLDMSGGLPGVLVSPDAAGGYPRIVGNRLEFRPDTDCPPPNATYKCFAANNDYQIVVTNSLQNTAGINLDCVGHSCTANFRTNDIVDTTPPQVSVYTLKQICAGTTNTVNASGKDDSGIAYFEFYYDGGSGDVLIPFPLGPSCIGVAPNVNCSDQVDWDTSGDPDLVAGGTAFLKAKAMDLDSNEKMSSAYKVILRAAHCCNGFQDLDEEAVDCGGADCAACDGAACDIDTPTPGCQPDDMVCASVFCDPTPCTCQQPPIIDWIRPVGGFCDGSINTPCNDDADCSAFTPSTCNTTEPNGRPGNFVTIGGRFFGTTSGTVNFRGAVGWIAASFPSLVNPSCPDTWTDRQIVVVVPNGAVDGPVQVETAAGYTDQTDDTRGPLVPDFLVNTITRPGLCQAMPNSGPYATLVNLSGVRFGPAASRTIEFGNDVSFVPGDNINFISDQNATVNVPNLKPTDVGLRVKTDNIYSNYLSFKVLPGTAGGPYISYLNPTSGPVGQYVTIFGGNFGNQIGTVKFIDGGGSEVNADVSFPSECLNSFWHNNYIVVKVPNVSGVNDVKVITQAGKESNVVPFTVTAGTPGPGICALIPDNGPVGTAVDFFGDNFGSGGGLSNVIFHNALPASSIGSWNPQEILDGAVPLGAVTGPVFARNSAGQPSNQVPFRVGACQDSSQCQAGEECCDDKTCRVLCPVKTEAIYGWSFTTGDYFVAQNCIRDVEIPATGPKGDNVCVNAQIAARFTTVVDNDTVVDPADPSNHLNVVVERCDNDECSTSSPLAGTITMITLATDPVTEGFTFTPNAPVILFDQNTTYRVTLRGGPGGIEDESGMPLIDDFSWTFKTRNDGRQCEIDKINVAPNNAKLVLMGATQDFVALITAKEDPCILIDPKGYTWAWQSSDPAVALISGFAANTATAVAMNTGTTYIKALIPSENKSGTARLIVDLSGLQVLSAVPNCDTTCTNAQIRARFSNWVDDSTLAGNLFVYQCPNKICGSGFVPVALDGVNPFSYFWNGLTGDSLLDINPAANFNPNTFYRVIIKGGSNGIKNYLGGGLSNPNYKSSAGEECEPPGSPGCSATCLHTSGECTPGTLGCDAINGIHTGSIGSSCGNGVVEPARGENCDPNAPGYGPSGCDSSTCLLKGSVFPAICGDSLTPDKFHGEACDDRNQTAGDGCSPKCLHEGTSAPTCGNSTVDIGEDCDIALTPIGCSSRCLAEGAIGSVCGDSRIGLGEDCDDGNTQGGDGCSYDSDCSDGGCCLSEGPVGLAVCGNGVVEDGKIADSYSWVFGVGNAVCQPLRSEVVPISLITTMGKTIDYLANIYSLADECSPQGQLLDADDYPWQWTTNNPFVADFNPAADNKPAQKVEAKNIGSAQICASADTSTPPDGTYDLPGCADIVVQTGGNRKCQQSGNACCAGGASSCDLAYKCLENQSLPPCPWSAGYGQDCLCCCDPTDDKCPAPLSCYADKAPCAGANRGLCCGCKQDSECPDPISEGCGSDACCHPRPAVLLPTSPDNGDANVCRNLKIRVDFDPIEPMDVASFTGKVELFDTASSTYVTGKVTSAGNTVLYFSPSKLLRERISYRVTVKKEVQSKFKVSMAADYIFNFTPGDIICEADYLKISIQHDANPLVVTNKDLFTCAKTNGCVDDTDGPTPGNQHLYLAEVMDMTGVVLTGYDYSWQTTDPDDIINPNTWTLNNLTVTANNKNGRATYNVKATPQPASGNVGTVSNYVYVTNFICENPWPAVDNWPWFDDSILNPNSVCNTLGCSNVDTHFQIMYCRDAGGPGTADDLPPLSNPPLIPGQSGNLLKEFYFVVP